jgi:hypothetical protein
MSTIDQARAFLALRETITALRKEFGESAAWNIVYRAVEANVQGEKYYIHKVSKPVLKRLLDNKKTGELA